MRRRVLVTTALAAVTAVGAGGYGVWTSRAATDQAEAAETATSTATAEVVRQDLVETEQLDGALGFAGQQTLSAERPGTVTRLPADGATVKRGQALYWLDERPTVLLHGPVPMYRTLTLGVPAGRDVRQLEANLAALGYTGFTVNDTFTVATAAAVREWQDDLGVPETGRVEIGQAVFLPGAVRVGERKVAVGSRVGPGTPVLVISGSGRVVTVDVPADRARIARQGDAVTIGLPDGRDVRGRVTTVGRVARSSGSGESAQTVITVVVTVDQRDAATTGDLDQTPVVVTFVTERKKSVLTVPVQALVALAEGGHAVEVVDGGRTRLVGVRTGLYASGRVEVSGSGLAAGQRVVVPA